MRRLTVYDMSGLFFDLSIREQAKRGGRLEKMNKCMS